MCVYIYSNQICIYFLFFRDRIKKLKTINISQSTIDTYHEIIMDTYDTVCKIKIRLGGKYLPVCHVMDGQKYVCMDELVEDIRNENCIVYSFGIGEDWSFEEAIAGMGCNVYAYDPTIDPPKFLSGKIKFTRLGVLGVSKNSNQNYHTLDHIFRDNGHIRANISYMKLDIESHELSGLPVWLNSGLLNQVQQIAVEIHLQASEEQPTLDFLQTFKNLSLVGNFRHFNWEANNCWKNLNKNMNFFGLVEIVLKKINPTTSCSG